MPDFSTDRLVVLQERIRVLELYLREKLDESNWHGVRDAAADIEVLAARINEIQRV